MRVKTKIAAANNAAIWVRRISCTHGDLNATNIAIDLGAPGRPHAYVFDAAGIGPAIEMANWRSATKSQSSRWGG